MSWDTSDPAFMGAVLLATVGGLVASIGMDMRRLPLGRIKYVPWTMLTLVFLLASILSARTLLIDLLRG